MGSPDTIAAKIIEIQDETGLDGMLLTFPDFARGMTFFGERIMPKLQERGLQRSAWGNKLVAV
jgi:pyrimidine oxygenase